MENLKLLAFAADLLFVFSRYHKKIQLENFNITNLPDWKSSVMKMLGGWESEFQQQYQPANSFFWVSSLKA